MSEYIVFYVYWWFLVILVHFSLEVMLPPLPPLDFKLAYFVRHSQSLRKNRAFSVGVCLFFYRNVTTEKNETVIWFVCNL